jgi:hypothetical protein
VRARWDEDPRGQGVADAEAFAPGVEELVVAMREPNWVAEEPEAHLQPHLEAACADSNSPLALESTRVDEDGSLVLELRWKGAANDKQGARSAAFALIGSVAESASYVREGVEDDVATYDVVTGMLQPDTRFASHGHVLRLRVRLPG